ncbi:MAG: hypothetical protein MnENMB40S_30180 [Rhizobiaceae bacterium MnEN-MB40S]|nr:MAG: hypothetical protein MnENMB40S_30180 [Rhizobiaceae bacterium MnEN-MB40S]
MIDQSRVLEDFEKCGRIWLRRAVSQFELRKLEDLLSSEGAPGARVAGDDPLYRAIAEADFTRQLKTVWPGARPVRLVTFDKTPSANWSVPWHQDRIIAVRDRHDVPGFTNWSQKSGVWHCEPPESFLQSMLFVRVHIDKNTAENGAMEIALDSHRAGLIRSSAAVAAAEGFERELADAEPGDILVLAMLTLHRSLPSKSSDKRRALRIDYALSELPHPLEWY